MNSLENMTSWVPMDFLDIRNILDLVVQRLPGVLGVQGLQGFQNQGTTRTQGTPHATFTPGIPGAKSIAVGKEIIYPIPHCHTMYLSTKQLD